MTRGMRGMAATGRRMQTGVVGWSENEYAIQHAADLQLGPEAETDGWLLTTGAMSEERGREKYVTMREQH